MPTDKRERKKEGRRARQEAMRAAQRRAAQRRALVTAVLVGVLVVVVVSLVSRGKKTKPTAQSKPVVLKPVPQGARVSGDTPCPKPDGSSERTTSFANPPPMCIDPAKSYTATMKTTKGVMTIALDPKKAPTTANNFVVLARYHYFDGVPFHRIIPGFVIQGGDPQASGLGGPGYKFADELPQAGEYKEGSLAMANSGPNTNGSQFFIITGAQGAALPPQYSLFGQITEGLEVAKKLEAVGTPGEGKPSQLVKIDSVTIAES